MSPSAESTRPHRPHVAQIATRMDTGGVPSHIMTLARGLQCNYAVTLVCGKLDPKHESALAAAGVPVIFVDFRRLLHPLADIRTLVTLVRILRAGRFDVVHTHMSKAALVGSIAAVIARVPVVVNTAHNLGFVAMPHAVLRALFWLYDRMLFAAAVDSVITVAENVRARMVSSRMIALDKVVSIHNGIDTALFDKRPAAAAECRSEFSNEPDAVLIVTVARLVWFKGLDTLIDAAHAVFAECPLARLVIVGDGPLHDRLVEQAAQLGIADRVLFTGERIDIPAILGAADIFVLSSVSEGMPISILEAMASAKPVVATAVGGVPELLTEGETGLLVPPAQPAALATALVKLACDPELRRSMGARGRARVDQEFSASAMVERTAALYARLLRQKAGRQSTGRFFRPAPHRENSDVV